MVPSLNFNESYVGGEYTILPSLGGIGGGQGALINQKMVKNR